MTRCQREGCHDVPEPRYYAEEDGYGWWVVDSEGSLDVLSFPSWHPDPEGGAEAEAARLNNREVG